MKKNIAVRFNSTGTISTHKYGETPVKSKKKRERKIEEQCFSCTKDVNKCKGDCKFL